MSTAAAITAVIEGTTVTSTGIEQWEKIRSTAVLKKFRRQLGSRAIAELVPTATSSSVPDAATRRSEQP